MKDKAIKIVKSWQWFVKSWTVYGAALLMASPDIIAFLPSLKEHMTHDLYSLIFRVAGIAFILFRIKTQIQK